MVTSPRECSFCHHVYANPCDGEDATCNNKLFIDGKVPGIVDDLVRHERPKRERVPLLSKQKRKRERVPLRSRQ